MMLSLLDHRGKEGWIRVLCALALAISPVGCSSESDIGGATGAGGNGARDDGGRGDSSVSAGTAGRGGDSTRADGGQASQPGDSSANTTDGAQDGGPMFLCPVDTGVTQVRVAAGAG